MSRVTASLLATKIQLPEFMKGICAAEKYQRWVDRKAKTHVRRDRRRGNATALLSNYKAAIHLAVLRSGGRDAYTGLPLRWDLISRYDNVASRKGRGAYKRRFGDLPTVDHVAHGFGKTDFAICAWRVNDAKSDLTPDELFELCQAVVDFKMKESD